MGDFAHVRDVTASTRQLASILLGLLLLGTLAASPAGADCATPISAGANPLTNDCLFILRTSVELEHCRPCVCDVNASDGVTSSDALSCLRAAVGQPGALACPACLETTTTTTMAPGPCPDVLEWTVEPGIGEGCESNSDCTPGACDEDLGRCRTPSGIDIGWTGMGHGVETNSGDTIRVRIDCESDGPVCGECAILGIDPEPGNCRCANDTRTRCDEPFATAASDCPACVGENVGAACETNADCGTQGTCTGQAACHCYRGAPFPVVAGGLPLCFIERLASDVTGSVDVDLGAVSVSTSVRMMTYLGPSVYGPCPTCGGTCSNDALKACDLDADCFPGTCNRDDVLADGVRNGICRQGENAGEPCDATAQNATFSLRYAGPDGAAYSLDCMPSVGFNVSGAGLAVRFVETTDADELHAEVSCGAPYADLSCPCRSCSTDTGEACNTDLDCQHQRGACSLAAGLQKALCDETADCKGIDVGPCSSLTDRCRSATSIACESNSDCSNVDAGDCLPSTCSVRGNGVNTMPNQCEDGLCSATGENQGRCETGPDIKYCDYAVTSDGEGVIPCLSDEDCIPPFIEVVGGNHCTMVQRLACFPDPIVTTGASDPGHPLTSAAFCMSAGTNVGKSEAFGLPGPVRLHRQLAMRSLCAADHDQSYEPGFGGCP